MTKPNFSNWLDFEPYSMDATRKSRLLTAALAELTIWHQRNCPEYARILALIGDSSASINTLEDIPYIPVRLFKEFDLLSVERDQIFKTMTSSGTSSQQVSRIYLDRDNVSFQSKVLVRLMATVFGKKRLPMLIIDSPSVLRDRFAFSARGAGILGFSMFGHDLTYALDDRMKLDLPAIEAFLERHAGKPIFMFGFTFMIWQYFYTAIKELGVSLPIQNGILLHGGGWKKLQDQAVGNHEFLSAMVESAGVQRVISYYGMVEQTGSIYLECEEGHLHAPIYSDIIIRNPVDFRPMSVGETGLIEVLSLLPLSYPGHALLTEDIGIIKGEDDCPCGRLGKYFSVVGRVAKAEVRGCSDTYEARL